jgi:hypothetical protein
MTIKVMGNRGLVKCQFLMTRIGAADTSLTWLS